MRIPKGKLQVIEEAPTARFLLVVDAMDGEIRMEKDGRSLLVMQMDEAGTVTATVCLPDGMTAVLHGADAYHKEVILTSGYARLGLYVNGVLQDEEFFYQPLSYLGAVIHAGSYMHFEAGYEYHSMPETAITPDVVGEVNGFLPVGAELRVRAVLPHVFGERLHLFYLDERRGGRAKSGGGANRLDALYSEDGLTYGLAPMALPIDSVEELRIADAAAVEVKGRYYLYYLVDYRGGRALSCAVSEDGFSYVKTGLDVVIPHTDARTLRSVAVFKKQGQVYLAYADGTGVFLAQSLDLLHFAAAERLPVAEAALDLQAMTDGDRAFLWIEHTDGTHLYTDHGTSLAYRLGAGERGVVYGGRLHTFRVGAQGEILSATADWTV